MSSTVYHFSINLSYAECEDLYKHQIRYIVVTELGGKRIQLPKHNLQKFVTPKGIIGIFELIVDQNQKITNIKQIK